MYFSMTSTLQFGYLVPAIEWTTFVCTHSFGAQWKSSFVKEPWWVKKVMANGEMILVVANHIHVKAMGKVNVNALREYHTYTLNVRFYLKLQEVVFLCPSCSFKSNLTLNTCIFCNNTTEISQHNYAIFLLGFKTSFGIIAISGLHALPIWLYGHYFGVLHAWHIPLFLQYVGIALLSAGRALCMAAEVTNFVS